jgi:hypothetical protein
MLLLEEYISNFMCARFYFLYLEFGDFYVDQSLAGQTILHLLFYQAAQYTLSIVTNMSVMNMRNLRLGIRLN